jgi:hypothetical protein
MKDFVKIGGGLILIFICVIFFEIVMGGFASLMGWSSGGSTIDTFTGLSPMIKISPMILWLITLGASIWLIISGALGLKGGKGTGGGSHGGGGMH